MNPSPLTPEQQQQMQALLGTPASVYNPTKKYIFLEDYVVKKFNPAGFGYNPNMINPDGTFNNQIPSSTSIVKTFKKGGIVDGYMIKNEYNSYSPYFIVVEGHKIPFGDVRNKPILKELNPQIAVDPSVIFKEKPTTTEKPATTENPTFFNKKNITTGVFVLVGIGVTLALLKWKKII